MNLPRLSKRRFVLRDQKPLAFVRGRCSGRQVTSVLRYSRCMFAYIHLGDINTHPELVALYLNWYTPLRKKDQ